MFDLKSLRDKTLGQTGRLLLRPFLLSDSEDFFEFLSHRETCYNDGGYQPYADMGEDYFSLMEQFLEEEGRIVLENRTSNKVVGTIKLSPVLDRAVVALEIGYVTSPKARRKGFCFEALSHIIQNLFSKTETRLLVIRAEIGNTPSQKLAEKLGFEREGIIKKGFYHPEKGIVDMVSYVLENPAFENL